MLALLQKRETALFRPPFSTICSSSEKLDFSKNDGRVLTTASSATIQRLGYLLENILGFHDVADMLSEFWHLYFKRPNYALMSPKSGQKAFLRNEHWKVDVNETIEIDDL